MKSRATSALALAAVLAAIPAASAAPASRETVRAVLMAKDRALMTAADWRRLGDDVDGVLVEAAGDPGLVYGARERAISGLGALGGARAQEFLRGVLKDPGAAPVLLAAAVHAYARGFAASDPAEAERIGVGLLGHGDWLVRRGAVRALGELQSDSAWAALVGLQSKEQHPAVRAALRSQLERGKQLSK